MKNLTLLLFLNVAFIGFGFSDKDSTKLDIDINNMRVENGYTPQYIVNTLQSYLRADKIQNSPFFRSKCYSLIGIVYRSTGTIDSALYYCEKSLYIRENNGYKIHAGSSHELLAEILYEMGEDSLALRHLYRSLEIKEADGNPVYLAPLYNSLGSAHFNGSNFDSAHYYITKSLMTSIEMNDTIGMASSYSNLGSILLNHNQEFPKAISYFEKGLSYYNSIGAYSRTIVSHFNIGVCHYNMSEFDSALYYYQDAKRLALRYEQADLLDYIYISIAEAYVELDELDSAIIMFQTYIDYRDSTVTAEKLSAIIEINTKYETKEKDQQIAYETAEKLRIKAEGENAKKTYFIILIVLVLILLFVLFLVRNARQSAKLKSLEVNVKNQEIDKILKSQEAKSYAALLEGQNVERDRISRDLHDRLGGTLSAVKIHFNLMDRKISTLQTENKELFDKVNGMLSEAVQDVRRISHDLASGTLSKLGLRGSLNDLCQSLNESQKLKVAFEMDANIPEFESKKEQEIYAIIQELMSNTLKHAGASQVNLNLNLIENHLTLEFEDNGSGFSMDSEYQKGLGLTSLQLRVERLKGEIEIKSTLGQGTIVSIKIPN